MVIGTAGHIDHGKSSLVEALTGVHPDRLPDEKRRGMTLDLGFGHVRLPGASGGFEAGIVDVPGHERFVRTMAAGAGAVDLMLLVVAADDGVRPQTREHFAICHLLGVRRAVMAITKCDLATPARREAVRQEIAALTAASPFAAAPVVEVSVRSGEGLDNLRQALAASGADSPRARDVPFRLPVDRVFLLHGFGVVATGTLIQGCLRRDALVEVAGTALRPRLRGMEVHGRQVGEAQAGQRTAVNLAGIRPDQLRRGSLLGEAGVFTACERLDAELETVPGIEAPPHRSRWRLHHLTGETGATLIRLGEHQGKLIVQLRLDHPLPAIPDDRFILRRFSPPETVAGGRVLDVAPPVHRARDFVPAAAFAARLAEAGEREQILLRLQRAGSAGLKVADLATSLGRRGSELGAELAAWAAPAPSGRAAVTLIGHPPVAILASTPPPLQSRPTGRPVASELRQRVEAAFRDAGWRADPLVQFLPRLGHPGARAAIAQLAREGVLIECRPGLFLHREAVGQLRQLLHAHRQNGAAFGVGEFKQWTGLSRKHAVPLLEYLDQCRLTRRQGERRIIAEPR